LRERAERHAGKFRQRAGVDDESQGRHRSGPWYKTEFYGNAGYGLHSNDIRGATITVDPIDKVTPQDRVPLLVRSKGAEIGIRTKAVEGLTSSLAVFVLISTRNCCSSATPAPPSRAAQPARRRRVDQPVQVLPWMRSISMSPIPARASPISIRRQFHSRRAGLGGERRRDVRRRERLVRRAAGRYFGRVR
jgi:hypothetical protein